jgi:hypothetical protein
VRGRVGGDVSCKLVALCGSVKLCELSLKETQSLAARPEAAWFLFFVLALASSSFSLSGCGSLRPSSQVSRAALGLLRYDGLERAQRGHPEVLVSSCFSPLRRELPVVREMSPSSQVSRGALAASLAVWV